MHITKARLDELFKEVEMTRLEVLKAGVAWRNAHPETWANMKNLPRNQRTPDHNLADALAKLDVVEENFIETIANTHPQISHRL